MLSGFPFPFLFFPDHGQYYGSSWIEVKIRMYIR